MVKIATDYRRGQFEKRIHVKTSDPEHPLVTLVVRARVEEVLRVLPRMLNFGSVAPGQQPQALVQVFNAGKVKLEQLTVEVNPQNVLEVSPLEPFALAPGEAQTLTVRLKPRQETGQVYATIIIHTGVNEIPGKYARVAARIVAPATGVTPAPSPEKDLK